MQLTLVATMVSASLCSLTAQLGLPPKLVPLSACGALLLRSSATLHTDCAQLVIRKGAARVTLAALKDAAHIDARAKAVGASDAFSAAIRAGVPSPLAP